MQCTLIIQQWARNRDNINTEKQMAWETGRASKQSRQFLSNWTKVSPYPVDQIDTCVSASSLSILNLFSISLYPSPSLHHPFFQSSLQWNRLLAD